MTLELALYHSATHDDCRVTFSGSVTMNYATRPSQGCILLDFERGAETERATLGAPLWGYEFTALGYRYVCHADPVDVAPRTCRLELLGPSAAPVAG